MDDDIRLTELKKLRVKFEGGLINKLPKPTKQQTENVRQNFKNGIRCTLCGGWHDPKVVHLDYVGHAALTSRFLDVDPLWNWEPFAIDASGLPALDRDNLLWIKLTVCGMTRIGVGDAGGKQGGDAMKERIGDALRNAGMRFGAALDLWHKGDLEVDEGGDDDSNPQAKDVEEDSKEDAKKDTKKDDKPLLTPANKDLWRRAVDSCKKNGNLDAVLAAVDIAVEDRAAILAQAQAERYEDAQAVVYEEEAKATHKTENV
jgi:hypothetical protein